MAKRSPKAKKSPARAKGKSGGKRSGKKGRSGKSGGSKKSPKKNKCKMSFKMGTGGGGRGRAGNRGKVAKRGKSGKRGKRGTNKGTSLANASRMIHPVRGARPTALRGRIYYGSGMWGGGGGGGGGGDIKLQVGGGGGAATAAAATSSSSSSSSPIRTSCNPHSASSYPWAGTSSQPSMRQSFSRVAAPWLDPATVSYDATNSGIYGAGVGAVFSTILKTLVPVFKGVFRVGSAVAKSPVGQAIKKEVVRSGLNAGINVVGDALKGKNLLRSARARVSQQAKKLPSNIEKAVAKVPPQKPPPKSSSSSSSKSSSTTRTSTKAIRVSPRRPTMTSRPPDAVTGRKRSSSSALRSASSKVSKLLKKTTAAITGSSPRRKDIFAK